MRGFKHAMAAAIAGRCLWAAVPFVRHWMLYSVMVPMYCFPG